MKEDQESSYRMNIRIPMAQYELMKKHGAVMGLTTDAACVKHFLTMGLQATAGTFSSVITGSATVEFMQKMKDAMTEATNDVNAKQLDIVEEAKKKGQPRARARIMFNNKAISRNAFGEEIMKSWT